MTADKFIVYYKFLHNDNIVLDEYFLMAFKFLQTPLKTYRTNSVTCSQV